MVASSHPPLTVVMTECPCELLHMDLVGPARVQSAGGKVVRPSCGGRLLSVCVRVLSLG
jgi:hypothetical protein